MLMWRKFLLCVASLCFAMLLLVWCALCGYHDACVGRSGIATVLVCGVVAAIGIPVAAACRNSSTLAGALVGWGAALVQGWLLLVWLLPAMRARLPEDVLWYGALLLPATVLPWLLGLHAAKVQARWRAAADSAARVGICVVNAVWGAWLLWLTWFMLDYFRMDVIVLLAVFSLLGGLAAWGHAAVVWMKRFRLTAPWWSFVARMLSLLVVSVFCILGGFFFVLSLLGVLDFSQGFTRAAYLSQCYKCSYIASLSLYLLSMLVCYCKYSKGWDKTA